MTYQIRLCRKDEVQKLKTFLRSYWNSDHIFLRNQDLLDWQHLEDDHYNFVVANHEKNDTFHGILGFISHDFFSHGKVLPYGHIWLAIWMVEKTLAVSNSIGIDLLKFIEKTYTPKIISAIGINEKVSHVYRLMGFRVGMLKQGFILNDNIGKLEIARISKNKLITNEQKKEIKFDYKIITISKRKVINLNICSNSNDRKFDIDYIKQRYINHPCYEYCFYVIKNKTSHLALFIARIIEVSNNRCLRVVDVIGLKNINNNLYVPLREILVKNNFEYIDIIVSPSDYGTFERMGFQWNTEDCFVPHLFEPLVMSKTEILFATNSKDNISIFKADSDLDRPNI